jgi:tRNA threonylcarbamoyladenosine modification (KEOPS) complex Cgi121 subunit
MPTNVESTVFAEAAHSVGRQNHLEQPSHAQAVNSPFIDTASYFIAFAANKAATSWNFGVDTTRST